MNYDAVLIHPPAMFDFREKAIFPGPIGYTVSGSSGQFSMPPVGMLSIAEYLDRHGFKVTVDNIGERMLTIPNFAVEQYIARLSAKVYSIGLHWCVHSQGAIEIARICKRLHPEALVVLGGLTATVFAEEAVEKYPFVDAVLRGEAEKPFLALLRSLGKNPDLGSVPNLTYHDAAGAVHSNPLMTPDGDLDEYEFTRLDFLEPKGAVFPPGMLPSWVVPIARGCLHNCVSCGGSAYSYRTHLGRQKPAFRSPEKIVKDLRKLSKQGIQLVFLFQDPRMGGEAYWRKLLTALQNEKIQLRQLTLELFGPADEEFIRELSKINIPVRLSISPESGVDTVRGSHGRKYNNAAIYNTIDLCKQYGIALGSFSMIALANDTPETIQQTWKSWEQICSLNVNHQAPVDYAFGPMILLDPGSLAFDRASSYGYRPVFKTLEDYIAGLSLPAWHQWISYETKFLDREAIAKWTIDSLEFSIDLRRRIGFYSPQEAALARFAFVEAGRQTIATVNEAMQIADEQARLEKLKAFSRQLDERISQLSQPR